MKFIVENLGKVAKAEIDLKPLTIFIGKNGSGKTYVASALWAYITYIQNKRNFKALLPDVIYTEIIEKINKINEEISKGQKNENSFTLDGEKLEKIYQHIKTNLNKNSTEILRDCFRYNLNEAITFNFQMEKKFNSDFTVKFFLEQKIGSYGEPESDNKFIWNECKITLNKFTKQIGLPKSLKLKNADLTNFFSNFIIKELISYVIFQDDMRIFDRIIYIPAARTGLMFGLHNFAQQSLNEEAFQDFDFQDFDNERNNLRYSGLLTAPLNNFIAQAHKASVFGFRHKLNSHKNLKVQRLLEGIIETDSSRRYRFIPNNDTNTQIPLPATSSLVTEVSALAIFEEEIKTGRCFTIFEEPEAHLHLSAQREMAKIIVEMVNQGCHMLITTHSDTFLQQLNNLIMLNQLAKNDPNVLQKFNISKNETIAGDKVAVYDFQCKDKERSTAIALELKDYGFVVPSVNEEINNLILETDTIIDLVDKLESVDE